MLSENRNALVVDVELTEADPWSSQGQAGTPNGKPPCQCSKAAACPALDAGSGGRATLGADRACGTRDFVWDLRALGVTPHIAQNEQGRRSAIDRRTTRHPGYARSQRRRKIVEEVFGSIKTVGAGGKMRDRGRTRNKLWFELTGAAFNLTRLANIEAAAAILNRSDAASSIGSSAPDPAL